MTTTPDPTTRDIETVVNRLARDAAETILQIYDMSCCTLEEVLEAITAEIYGLRSDLEPDDAAAWHPADDPTHLTSSRY